jgi:hypothetical protein
LIPAKTLPMKIKVLWFAASIICSLWYTYWIFYDVFVWDKALTQVRPVNYVGLTLFMALTILGTQLEKAAIFKKLMLLVDIVRKKPQTKNTQKVRQIEQIPEEKRIQSMAQTRQIQPTNDTKTRITNGNKIPLGCSFYLGYLYKRPKSTEIPEKCLMCEYVVNCLSPSARNIEQIPVKS